MVRVGWVGVGVWALISCGRVEPVGSDTPEARTSQAIALVEVSIPDKLGNLHRGTALLPARVGDKADEIVTMAKVRVLTRSDEAVSTRKPGPGSDPTGIDTLPFAQRLENAKVQLSAALEKDPDLSFLSLVFEEKDVVGFDSMVLPGSALSAPKKSRGVSHIGFTLAGSTSVNSATYNCPAGSEINYGETNYTGGGFGTFLRKVNGSQLDSVGVQAHYSTFTLSNRSGNHYPLVFTLVPDGSSSVYAHLWCYYYGI